MLIIHRQNIALVFHVVAFSVSSIRKLSGLIRLRIVTA